MNETSRSSDSVKFEALVEVERRLANLFDAEESFISRMSFQNLKREERTDARLYATKILLEIRYTVLLHMSQKLGSLHAGQGSEIQHHSPSTKDTSPVGRALVLRCLETSMV